MNSLKSLRPTQKQGEGEFFKGSSLFKDKRNAQAGAEIGQNGAF